MSKSQPATETSAEDSDLVSVRSCQKASRAAAGQLGRRGCQQHRLGRFGEFVENKFGN